MKEYRSAAYTLMGRRTRNQDNFLLNGAFLTDKHSADTANAFGKLNGLVFAAVVDGNGTKSTGEAASRMICERFRNIQEKLEEVNELAEAGEIINSTLVDANKEIEAIVENNPTCKMGATAAVLLLFGGKAFFGNVGDSAVYLRRNDTITKLTTDHTEGEELVARGALTRDMLKNHSSRTKVTRMIGYMSFGQTDIMQFYDVMDVQDGDVFILGSPGIVQYMTPEEIDQSLQTCVDVVKSAERVGKAAYNDFESKDNITAIVMRINEEADNVGSVKARKVKPVKNNGVRLHTDVQIDVKALLRTLYIILIAVILVGAVLYVFFKYPRHNMLEHMDFDGISWGSGTDSETEGNTVPTAAPETEKEEKKDNAEKSDDAKSSETSKKKDKKASGKH